MKANRKQLRSILSAKEEHIRALRHEFILEHVPRFHRLIMELFPNTTQWFGYMLADEENDKTKLTLIRNKKAIARNF